MHALATTCCSSRQATVPKAELEHLQAAIAGSTDSARVSGPTSAVAADCE